MVTVTGVLAPPKCDGSSRGRTVTDWGEQALPCLTTVGLRSFVDRSGVTRYHCAVDAHRRDVERRYGRAMYEGMD